MSVNIKTIIYRIVLLSENKPQRIKMEKEFIAYIREKFQTPNSRHTLLKLMVQEIQLDLMKKKQHDISLTESCEVFIEEVKDMCDALIYKERQVVIQSTLKQFGFTS